MCCINKSCFVCASVLQGPIALGAKLNERALFERMRGQCTALRDAIKSGLGGPHGNPRTRPGYVVSAMAPAAGLQTMSAPGAPTRLRSHS